ncbi:hypothetical protein JOF53_007419 [Crossiella equi]|uniref:Secreted protein n=1 Tax=Crossiella equi TaxID=130796 RepID=A0ABS5AQM0_9PSEU|nr:hypothetical protein [Crossiella equi]MBP2478547.1 hypothetical protein [Crossiella equi]
MRVRILRRVSAVAAATAAALALVPSGTAAAAGHCDFSMTTNRYSCSGPDAVRGPNDVIGARVFTGQDFRGDSLTIWVSRPCPKNNVVDHFISLGGGWRNSISSVQGWSTCWVWLYAEDGTRQGPHRGNVSELGNFNDRTVTVGLS